MEPTTFTSEFIPSLTEQPRLWLKLLQLTVKVRSYKGRPLQRSGEYDFFFRMNPSALDQWWTLRTLVMSLCRLCPHSSHPSNLQDRTSARLLTSSFHGGA